MKALPSKTPPPPTFAASQRPAVGPRIWVVRILIGALPWFTTLWVFIELLSLRLGLLNRFFFDTLHADVQGIDFYSLPKAWLNLASSRSLYATFDTPTFGAHFTWYLAHPLLAVVLGWPLSHLDPTDSYGVFTLFSLVLMAACAGLLARESNDLLTRRLIWLLLLGAFPTFDMLYVGNVQAITVLGLTLLFIGLLRLVHGQTAAPRFLLAGLLVSLFSKPVVLLILPLLLLARETRRAAWQALAVYVPVSFLFLTVPFLNPESVGLARIAWLALHPAFVRDTMEIYRNHLHLTPDMRDNSIHWFNLVAQSHFRFNHIDVVSLPLFLDGLFRTRTPDWLYTLPPLAVLALSVVVSRIPNTLLRREGVLLLTLTASLSFFLSYPTVWEYQYTAVLPVLAVLLLHRSAAVLSPRLRAWCLALGGCTALPSLYFLSGSPSPTPAVVTLVRLDRVVPVTALFLLLITAITKAVLTASPRPSAAKTTPGCSSQAETPA